MKGPHNDHPPDLPALLAELDREMQEQAEDWALLVAQMEAPAVGGLDYEEIPW